MTKNGILRQLMHLTFILSGIVVGIDHVSAQAPVNDNCANAIVIELGAGNYATGVFISDTSNLRNASIQTGEQFHASMTSSGNTDKSVWFKFTLPTKRGIKIELKQPGNSIISTDVGFTTYKSGTCFPPLSAVSSAYITPLAQFGSSFHPCMEPGEYLIQVSSRNRASGIIQIEITSSYPYTHSTVGNAVYDLPDSAYQFGTIGKKQTFIDYETGCHSIEDSSEWCPAIDTAYKRYIQSSWHTFRTDYRVDFLELLLGPAPGQTFNQGTIIGYNLYEGDVRSQSHKTLKRIDSCDKFLFDRLVNTSNDPLRKEYICELDPQKTYSIQLLFRDDFSKKIRLTIRNVTSDSATRAPKPVRSAMHSKNLMGKLTVDNTSVSHSMRDYFSCESRLSNPVNACGQVNPSGGIRRGIFTYGLSTWFEFELDEAANVIIEFPFDSTHSPCNPFLVGRIFNDTITDNCNDIDTGRLLQWFSEKDPALLPCLQPGKYAVQILGVDHADYDFCDVGRHLGRNIEVRLRTIRGKEEHKFSLKNNAAVDSFNAVAGKLEPIKLGTAYTSQRDTLGCFRTVLPAKGLCGTSITKAMYRVFQIDDADNDNVPDSGLLVISNYSATAPHLLDYRLYKGNAQKIAQTENKYSYPDTLSGLWPLTDCFSADLTINTKSYCLTPGDYTLVSFGGDAQVGAHDAPQISFQKTVTRFKTPKEAEPLDTLRSTKASSVDYFSCYSNTATIDGAGPCYMGSKLIYRQFYLENPSFLNIFLTTGHTGTFTLFTGKASNGIDSLKVYRDNNGPWICFTNKRSTDCDPMPSGWYTLVAYSNGPGYDTTVSQFGTKGNIGAPNSAVFFFLPQPPRPKYNRPSKAYFADSLINIQRPLDFSNNLGNASNPQHKRTFILGQEIFDCYPDTPFSVHPINPCDTIFNRVAYYVFSISKQSHVKISNVAATHRIQVYDFDVRKTPNLLSSRPPVQSCYKDPRFTELCMLDSGFYTIVIFAGNIHLNRTVQPIVTVDSVGRSRFDFAANAYDFGEIPGDSAFRNGKLGDIHPVDASLPPSADIFYCTTGAAESDPFLSCNGTYNPSVYASSNNFALWNNDTLIPNVIRRNIWYTFTLKGTGTATVKLNNLSQGLSYVSPLAVYASDVYAGIPFDTLRKNGGIDSTLTLGLSEVARNYQSSCNNSFTATFKKELCDTFFERRYYVQVGLFAQNLFKYIDPLAQVSIEILYDTIDLPPLRFDHYREANLINGFNQSTPPYTQISPAEGNTYTGFTGTFKGATVSSTDQNPACATGNIWYRTDVDTTGKLFINYKLNKDSLFGRPQNNNTVINLFRSVVPGDSTSNGLIKIPYTDQYEAASNSYWARACVAPGTYYIQLNNCGITCSDLITPYIKYDFDPGDQCGTPADIHLEAGKSAAGTLVVDCHTIGEGFGEDGTNMGCLYGPSGYKSSWFKVEYTDSSKVDMLFELKENTTATASQIRYRVFYGQCSYLSVGPCNSSSLTQFELKCMQKGTYYVQVVSPENATGSLELKITAVVATDTLCIPIDPFKPFANFNFDVRCNDNRVNFTNLSTQGDSVVYSWDFGHNASSDTSFHTSYTYPMLNAPATYSVRLIVNNIARNASDTLIRDITVFHRPDPWLSADTTVCPGEPVQVSGRPFAAGNVRWFDNDTSEVRVFNLPGIYHVSARVDTCIFYDSIQISNFQAPTLFIGADAEICDEDSFRIAAPDSFSTYLWNTGSVDSFITVYTQGTYSLEISDRNGCVANDSLFLRVNALPDARITQAGPYCISDLAAQIQATVNSGGSFSGGTFISSTGSFDPRLSGAGLHKIYYAFTDNKGCNNRDSINIRVHALPDASLRPQAPLCIDAASVQITAQTNNGGTFSGGAYVSSTGSFNPATAGAGLHRIYYTYTDANACSNNDSIDIRVHPLPDASIQSTGPFCIDAGIQQIIAAVNTGGNFSGGAYIQVNGNFNPQTAGAGLHKVSYFYTDINGCSNNDSTLIRVHALPRAEIQTPTAVCVDTDSIMLLPAHQSGGYFYGGSYIDSNGTFRPRISGDGLFPVYYHITDINGCENDDSTEVRIHPLPDAGIMAMGPYCIDAGIFNAQPRTNSGGRFFHTSGLLIDSAGSFNTAQAGPGLHRIYYHFIDVNGCHNLDSTEIRVHALPDASISPSGPFCIDAGIQTITAAVNSGGSYSGGTYVSTTGAFRPELAGAGLHKIHYTFTDTNGCFNRDSTLIRVHALPDAQIQAAGPWCVDHAAVQLAALQNAGGVFNGGAFIRADGQFNPAIAGPGNHKIYYAFTDANACSNRDSILVTVHTLPDASINPAGPFCVDAGLQQLSASVNAGGTFAGGSYISADGRFNPAISGIGRHKVTYHFTDNNGCSNRDSIQLTIHALPDPSITPAGPFCVSAGLMPITPRSNSGGIFSGGTYIQSNGQFDTRVSGTGLHRVRYEITDANGCYSKDSIHVRVHTLPDARIQNSGPWCADDADVVMLPLSNAGGTFIGGAYVLGSGVFSPQTAGAGLHKVYYTVTDINMCRNTDSTEVRVHPLPDPTFTADRLEGCTVLPVNFTGPAGMRSYAWEFSNGVQSNEVSPRVLMPTGTWSATLLIVDNNGCKNRQARNNYILVHPLPVSLFDFSPKEIYIREPKVNYENRSQGNVVTWNWDLGDGSTSNQMNPVHEYADTGLYRVSLLVTDNNGCIDESEQEVAVRGEYILSIPNAFSPDGDGLNELFQAKGYGIKSIHYSIYNRWGEMLYDKIITDINSEGWDGMYRGEEVPMGAYLYQIQVEDLYREKHYYSGTVQLIR